MRSIVTDEGFTHQNRLASSFLHAQRAPAASSVSPCGLPASPKGKPFGTVRSRRLCRSKSLPLEEGGTARSAVTEGVLLGAKQSDYVLYSSVFVADCQQTPSVSFADSSLKREPFGLCALGAVVDAVSKGSRIGPRLGPLLRGLAARKG